MYNLFKTLILEGASRLAVEYMVLNDCRNTVKRPDDRAAVSLQ